MKHLKRTIGTILTCLAIVMTTAMAANSQAAMAACIEEEETVVN